MRDRDSAIQFRCQRAGSEPLKLEFQSNQKMIRCTVNKNSKNFKKIQITACEKRHLML